MAILDDIENMIASLSRAEKARLLLAVARDLGDPYPGIDS
jgi:hypothetical protein